MQTKTYSYRFAEEIFRHSSHQPLWDEIIGTCENLPLYLWPNKSPKKANLDFVQQLANVYFDRRLAIDLGWDHHPLATAIATSGLRADFRKKFGNLSVQIEVQFGNMARWYSDVFKFQTAYSQGLIQGAICIIPMLDLATRTDQNITNFERVIRELPSAELSITLPILVIGICPDPDAVGIDVSTSGFDTIKDLTARGKSENLWRIVNNLLSGSDIREIGPQSPVGPTITLPEGVGEELE